MFAGKEFCVVNGPKHMPKNEIEKKIVEVCFNMQYSKHPQYYTALNISCGCVSLLPVSVCLVYLTSCHSMEVHSYKTLGPILSVY